jgi:hypothetical protein
MHGERDIVMDTIPPSSGERARANLGDFDIPGACESSTALHVLSGLPIDSTSEILAHYPAMKLGVRESVRICAAHLGIAAQRIINRVSPVGPWTIASPPRFILPGAANLMARDIHRHLPAYARNAALLLEPRLTPAVVPSDVTGSTRLYSQAHFDDRLQERKRLHERLPPLDPARCRGRHVLFINDINVTGSQQHFMRKAFEAAGAAGIHWLYLVTVPPAIGQAYPQIEYELNYSRFASFDEFTTLVSGEGIDFTARCVHRLFDHDEAQLRPFFRALKPARKSVLLRLATEEALCQGRSEDYWDKLRRLAEV